jgi:hypothetical protein
MQVNASSNPSALLMLAIPIETRFANPEDESEITSKYREAVGTNETFPCYIPSSPALFIHHSELDPGRNNEVWESVVILGSEEELDAYKRSFYIWLLMPLVFIVIGLLMFIISVRMLKKYNAGK